MTAELPRLLKHDAIIESLLELRFDHNQVGEVVIGRLASVPDWQGYSSQRLPFADLPQMVRDSDPNLRHQPILQFQDPTGKEVIKIGHRVISIHRLAGYPGWDDFKNRQITLIDNLLQFVPSVMINRMGLRYINALSPLQGFNSFWDMNLVVKVDGDRPAETMAANYRYPAGTNCEVQVSIAHPVYVNGPLIPGSVALIDVDVYTPQPIGPASRDALLQWLEDAHTHEKEAFFKLWPSDKLDSQRVD